MYVEGLALLGGVATEELSDQVTFEQLVRQVRKHILWVFGRAVFGAEGTVKSRVLVLGMLGRLAGL